MSNPATYLLSSWRLAYPTQINNWDQWTLLGTGDRQNPAVDSINLDEGYAVLWKIGNSGDMGQADQNWLQYRVDTGGGFGAWTNVTTTSSYVRVNTAAGGNDSAELATERLDTTARTFVTAVLEQGDGIIASVPRGGEDYEHTFCILFRSADITGSATIELRPARDGTTEYTFDGSMSAYPSIQFSGTRTASGSPSITKPTSSGAAFFDAFGELRQKATTSGTLGTGSTITFDRTPEAGNLLLVFANCEDASSECTTPSGWSTDASATKRLGTTGSSTAFWKISDGTETSVTLTWDSSTDRWTGLFAEFVGPWDASPFHLCTTYEHAAGNTSTALINTTEASMIMSVHCNDFGSADSIYTDEKMAQASTVGFNTTSQWIRPAQTASGTESLVLTWIDALGAGWGFAIAFIPPGANSASGSPSIGKPTSSGTAERILPASGAPSITKPTSTGSSTIRKIASGAATLAAIISAGSASVTQLPDQTATGSPSITKPTSTGVAERILPASGSPSITKPTSSGAAEIIKTASGSPSISKPTSTGSAQLAPRVWLNTTQTLDGATKMTVTAWSQDGTSITFTDPLGPPTGSIWLAVENPTGDIGWRAVTVTGQAADAFASGSPSITKPTATGSATRILPASGTPAITKPTSAGIAERILAASGSPSITKPTSAGAAERVLFAAGTPAITKPTAAGVAEVIKTASGAPAITKPTAAGSATRILPASGAPAITKPTATGTASVEGALSASGAPSLNPIVSAGSSRIIKTASGAVSIQPIVSAGSANRVGNVSASGAPSITKPTASGAADRILPASGSPQIANVTASGAASRILPASGAATITAVQSAGTAEIIKTASGSPAITAVTSAGSARFIWQASGSPQIEKPTSAGSAFKAGNLAASGAPSITKPTAAGTTALTRSASGSPQIAAVQSAGAVVFTRSASGSPSIEPITSAGSAFRAGNFSASGSPSISAITAAGASRIVKTGSGSPSITPIQSAGTTTVVRFAAGAPSINPVTAGGNVFATRFASGAVTLAKITSAGSSINSDAPRYPGVTVYVDISDVLVETYIADLQVTVDLDPLILNGLVSGGDIGSLNIDPVTPGFSTGFSKGFDIT